MKASLICKFFLQIISTNNFLKLFLQTISSNYFFESFLQIITSNNCLWLSMIPWFYDSMIPWYHNSIIPKFHGSLVPWFHDSKHVRNSISSNFKKMWLTHRQTDMTTYTDAIASKNTNSWVYKLKIKRQLFKFLYPVWPISFQKWTENSVWETRNQFDSPWYWHCFLGAKQTRSQPCAAAHHIIYYKN